MKNNPVKFVMSWQLLCFGKGRICQGFSVKGDNLVSVLAKGDTLVSVSVKEDQSN